MRSISKKAWKTFSKLTEGLDKPGDSRVIDNCDGAFMAVHVEVIGRPESGDGAPVRKEAKIVSVAHYYEQNGDLVCDPDCTFLVGVDQVFPMTFEQGGMFRDVAAKFEGGRLLFNKKRQSDLTTFCNGWMENIEHQQYA